MNKVETGTPAMNASHSAGILAEAMDTYLGWDVHRHS